MSNPVTIEQKAAAAYRLAVFRAKKRGEPAPDRATHIAAYVAAHGKPQSAACAANAEPDGSLHPPAGQSGATGHNDHAALATPAIESCNGATPVTPVETLVSAEKEAPCVAAGSGARGRRLPEKAADGSTLPVASQAVFEDAARRFASGEPWEDVSKALAVTWGDVVRRGRMEGNVDVWSEAQAEHKRRILSHVGESAARCAFDSVRVKRITKTQAGGLPEETVSEERYVDPALARIALEYASPEIYGKLAGARSSDTAVAVQVQISVSPNVVMPVSNR